MVVRVSLAHYVGSSSVPARTYAALLVLRVLLVVLVLLMVLVLLVMPYSAARTF
ncbi:hypothetical protein [Streptomyces sp. 150FB]|uniref:hypothetical protein n=1 Tax=Streptomyces sp. 150FB TaxID=1576605 RepID=UPI000AE0B82C|nr:hypothetical protein [Streptomyces sp. 150FB]